MHLEIITPDKKVYEGKTSEIEFSGVDGNFEVLPDHAPMISALKKGPLTFKSPEGEKSIVVDGGTVEVLKNKVIVLAEAVEEE